MAADNEDTPLLQNRVEHSEHQLTRSQKLVLSGILLSEFFNSATFYVAVVWFPTSLALKSLYFNIDDCWHSRNGTEASYNVIPAFGIGVLYTVSPIPGIIADNFIRKSRALIAGLVLTAVMYSLLVTEISFFAGYICHNGTTDSSHEHCYYSNTSMIQSFCSVSPPPSDPKPPSCVPLCYAETGIIILLICIAASFIRTVLPALGGDQISGTAETAGQMQYADGEPIYRQSIRKFYACFYWMDKLAEFIAALMAFIVAERLNNPYDTPNDQLWKIMLRDWIIVIAVFYVGVATFITLVTPKRKFRCLNSFEPRAQTAYIKTTINIYRNAFGRRKEYHSDIPCGCLHPAMVNNGGVFNRDAVTDRTQLAKLAMASILLLPLAFVTNTCSMIVYSGLLTRYLALKENEKAILKLAYVPVFNILTSVVAIPVLHIIFNIIKKRTRHRPKLLWRIIAGHIVMVLSCSACIVTIYCSGMSGTWRYGSAIAIYATPFMLLGLTNALVYTAGYEMTLTLSPRSSQCLSMGLFKMVDGIGTLLGTIPYFTPTYSLESDNATIWIISYIALLLVGAVAFWFLDKRFALGLRK